MQRIWVLHNLLSIDFTKFVLVCFREVRQITVIHLVIFIISVLTDLIRICEMRHSIIDKKFQNLLGILV